MAIDPKKIEEWTRVARIVKALSAGEPTPTPPSESGWSIYGDGWFKSEAVPVLEEAVPALLSEREEMQREYAALERRATALYVAEKQRAEEMGQALDRTVKRVEKAEAEREEMLSLLREVGAPGVLTCDEEHDFIAAPRADCACRSCALARRLAAFLGRE